MKTSRIKHILLRIGILCLASTHSTMAQGYDPEEYYTPDVEVINNLIKNNGLQANLNDPVGWANPTEQNNPIVVWNSTTPKQVLSINIVDRDLAGVASFAGLKNMELLHCSYNNLTELNLKGCEALQYLNCAHNNLTGVLSLTGFKSNLENFWDTFLDCSYNNLSGIDLTNCEVIYTLDCSYNNLTELVIPNNLWGNSFSCENNKITKLTIGNDGMLIDGLWCNNNSLIEIISDGGVLCNLLPAINIYRLLCIRKIEEHTHSQFL